MSMILETEVQNDLEQVYKIAGDLLNEIETREIGDGLQSGEEAGHLLELVKFRLEDMAGTLQKDIYTVRHILMNQQAGMYPGCGRKRGER